MSPARRQMALINVAHGLTHYCLLILSTAALAIAAQSAAFGSAYGPIVELATAMFVLYGLFSLPQGWLAARFGRKTMMGIFYFGLGASLVACGFASSPFVLMLTLASAGLFASIYHPIGTAMLVEAAGDKPGRAIGLNGVCGNIGVALAPVVTAFVAAGFGWQAAFVIPGALCCVFGVLWVRSPAVASQRHASAKAFPAIPRPLVRRAVIVLLLIAAVSGLVFNAFTLLLPKLLQERFGSNESLLPLLGVAAFLATLCGAVTQFTVGRALDRMTLKAVFLPLGVVLAPALVALAFVQGWMAAPVAGVVAAVIFGQVTVNETMTARYISPEMRARMYSVRFFVGFLGSSAAAPVVGLLHERTGDLTLSTLVLAGFSVVTLLCALFFPNRREELRPELWETARLDDAIAMPAPAE